MLLIQKTKDMLCIKRARGFSTFSMGIGMLRKSDNFFM